MRLSKNEKRRGFTLLEMLVVIGIIGILLGVGSVSFTAAQKRARDSRRRQDIGAISKALEQYYADNNGSYPIDTSCLGIESYFSAEVPTDPKTGAYDLDGACSGSGTAYCACALLEVVGTGNAVGRNGSACSFGGSSSKDYYCIQNVQ